MVLPFWYWLTWVVLDNGLLNGCVYQCLGRSNVIHNPHKLHLDLNRNTKNIKIIKIAIENVNLHTYIRPLNGPLSGTTQVSRYQKAKSNLDFTGARDSGWQWQQLGHMQVCTSLQTDNHASTPPLKFFYTPDALPAAQPTASKHWRQSVGGVAREKNCTRRRACCGRGGETWRSGRGCDVYNICTVDWSYMLACDIAVLQPVPGLTQRVLIVQITRTWC